MKKQFFSVIIAIAIAFSIPTYSCAEVAQASIIDPTADIVIIHTNDTHGCVKADDEKRIIGFDTIAAIKDSVSGKALLLDAGDMTSGRPFAAKSRGLAPIEAMNMIGYDAATIGNHEFDVPDNIGKIIAEANFPFLSANIRYLADNSLFAQANQIFTVSGVKIGVFGLTTTESAVNPLITGDLDFGTAESIKADAIRQAEALKSDGCDIVILLSHLGIDPAHSDVTSVDIANAVGGMVDVIIDGHSHSSPSLNQIVNGIPVVSTGAETDSNVGWVAFHKSNNNTYDVNYGFIDFDAARANYTPVAEVTQFINQLNIPVEEMANNVVATIDADLDGERNHIRTMETNLGNTIADAAATFTGADAAMMNSGGIRASLPKGDITELDVYTTIPYGDSVYMSEVQGSVIRAALEVACSNYPASEGTFAQVSGIAYSFDPSKEAGSRVVSVSINGAPLDDEGVYKLATNDFWAIGSNGYGVFVESFKTPCPYDKPQDSIYVMDVFVWYLNEMQGATSKTENRITVQ